MSGSGHYRPSVGSLCSGYTGLDMGLALALGVPIRHAWFVEYDGINKKGGLTGPRRLLDYHYPNVHNYGDLTTVDWTQVEPVDWLTAGYPCQPFSLSGLRKGADDERHLWPGVARAISVLRPRNVLLENVRGHVSLGLNAVVGDLAAMGYDCRWGVVRASAARAPHERARVFIAATDAQRAERWAATWHGGTSGEYLGEDGRKQGPGPLAGDLTLVEDANGATRGEWGLTAPGQTEGGRPWADAGGRGGASAPDTCGDGRCGNSQPHGGTLEPGLAASQRHDPHGRALPATPDTASDGRDEGRAEPARLERGSDAPERGSADVAWGVYEPAIRRWERATRPAPRPTEPGRTGERLSPRFVEWMQGLPDGWVTDVPGLTRNEKLKLLGNGVVPQQAALALHLLGTCDKELARDRSSVR